MPRGERLFKFLAGLIVRKFYGTVIIRFESGRVTHVETESRRMWRYGDLPEEMKSAPEWRKARSGVHLAQTPITVCGRSSVAPITGLRDYTPPTITSDFLRKGSYGKQFRQHVA